MIFESGRLIFNFIKMTYNITLNINYICYKIVFSPRQMIVRHKSAGLSHFYSSF
jgi:hypothetical protein